jgi:putative DNA primase/helicase
MASSSARRPAAEVIIECAADIPIKNPRWLLYHWLPLGELTLLAGMPGAGKTGLALDIAARVSNGDSRRGRWAGGLKAPFGSVIILTYEDQVSTTIMPRLVANDANMEKIHVIKGSVQHDGHERPFDFGTDLKILLQKIDEFGDVALVIIDPVISVVSGDALKNQEVRASFAPLIARAESRQFSILGITHFNKGSSKKSPLDRLTGSGAFGQLARAVLVAAKIEGEKDEHGRTQGILVRAKMLGPDGDGFLYSVNPTTVRADNDEMAETAGIVWQEQPLVEGGAKSLIAWAESGGNSDTEAPKKGKQAEDFVIQMLSDGAISTVRLQEEARKEGISQITLSRARKALKVVSSKVADQDGRMRTMLSLPDDLRSFNSSRRGAGSFRRSDDRHRPAESGAESRRQKDDQLDRVDQVVGEIGQMGKEDQQCWGAAGHDIGQQLAQAEEPTDQDIWAGSSHLTSF